MFEPTDRLRQQWLGLLSRCSRTSPPAWNRPPLAPSLPTPILPPPKSDFNLSKIMEDNAVMSSVAATNPRWLSPEILDGKKASYQSDVYAFG